MEEPRPKNIELLVAIGIVVIAVFVSTFVILNRRTQEVGNNLEYEESQVDLYGTNQHAPIEEELPEINYPDGTLNTNSNGTISYRSANRYDDPVAPGWPRAVILLVFTSKDTGKSEILLRDSSDSAHVWQRFFSGGNFYYSPTTEEYQPIVKSFNLLTQAKRVLPLINTPAAPLHDFFVKDNELYYITGPFCNDYMMECSNMFLRSYNLVTGAHQVLAQNSESRNIEGFDANGNLILSYKEADAGNYWASFESYNFATSVLNKLYSHSGGLQYGPEGDYMSPEDESKLKGPVIGVEYYDQIGIRNGKFYLSQTSEQDGLIRALSSEYPVE